MPVHINQLGQVIVLVFVFVYQFNLSFACTYYSLLAVTIEQKTHKAQSKIAHE